VQSKLRFVASQLVFWCAMIIWGAVLAVGIIVYGLVLTITSAVWAAWKWLRQR
jgi:hypothetical protein